MGILVVLNLIGICLSGLGAYMLFLFTPKPIKKIDWKFEDIDIENNATFPPDTTEEINELKRKRIPEALDEAIKSIEENNLGLIRKSRKGILVILLGVTIQVVVVFLEVLLEFLDGQ